MSGEQTPPNYIVHLGILVLPKEPLHSDGAFPQQIIQDQTSGHSATIYIIWCHGHIHNLRSRIKIHQEEFYPHLPVER